MHTHPILAAAILYAWAAFAAALLTLVFGKLHRDAKLAQRDAEGGEDAAARHAQSFPSNRNGGN